MKIYKSTTICKSSSKKNIFYSFDKIHKNEDNKLYTRFVKEVEFPDEKIVYVVFLEEQDYDYGLGSILRIFDNLEKAKEYFDNYNFQKHLSSECYYSLTLSLRVLNTNISCIIEEKEN